MLSNSLMRGPITEQQFVHSVLQTTTFDLVCTTCNIFAPFSVRTLLISEVVSTDEIVNNAPENVVKGFSLEKSSAETCQSVIVIEKGKLHLFEIILSLNIVLSLVHKFLK